MPDGAELRVGPAGGLFGGLTVPGDKSVSHRSVMLGSLADGRVRRAHAETNDGVFADWGIHHATREISCEIFCCLKRATETSDVLAVNKNARIFRQCARLRFANGFYISDGQGG